MDRNNHPKTPRSNQKNNKQTKEQQPQNDHAKAVDQFHSVKKKLERSGVKMLKVEWVDSANLIRFKSVPVSNILKNFESFNDYGVGVVASCMSLPVWADFVAQESNVPVTGEARLVPQWETLRCPLPYQTRWASVMGEFREVRTGKKWDWCYRTFLKNQIEKLKELELNLNVGFENEVVFSKITPNLAISTIDNTTYANTYATDTNVHLIDDILEALEKQSIVVDLYHPEAANGQHEFSIHYDAVLNSVDKQVAFRETVHAIAFKHHCRVSFIPKVFEGVGSGMHAHMSLWKNGKPIVSNAADELSEVCQQFMAGILFHLPGLMAASNPIPNSYRRILPSHWAGAFKCWGIENREGAIRVPIAPDKNLARYSNFELKSLDGSANLYLALGLVIACGIDGIKNKRILPPPVNVDPATLSDKEKKEKEIERLPTSLQQSLDAFINCDIFKTAMGKPLFDAFVAVRKAELKQFGGMNLEEEAQILFDKY